MKVLHVTPSYYPAIQFGGPVRSVHALNQALVKSGIDLEVVTTNAGLTDSKELELQKIVSVEGVPVIYFPFWGYQHYNFSISLLKYVFQKVKNVDVVHITAVWNFPVLATALACLWHKKPYILSPRGTIYAETIAHRSARIKKLYYTIIAGIPVRKANLLHFTTQDEADKVTKSLKLTNPYVTIFNGLSIPLPQNTTRLTASPYILFIGRLDKKKGLDLLVKSFALCLHQFPEYKLIIAGPDNEGYLKTIQNLCLQLHIQENVLFVGELEGDIKWNAYLHADLFALTSYSENFGMTVAEAMMLKCPVLISEKVGLAEHVEKHNLGWVCKIEVEDIRNKIQAALSSQETRDKRAVSAYAYASKFFEISGIAQQFIQAYRSIIQKR
jgi:glycosyltransferase involved in cell wall biosynthesis